MREQNEGHGRKSRHLFFWGRHLKHTIHEIKSKLALASRKLERLPCLVSIGPVRDRDGWMGWNEMIAATLQTEKYHQRWRYRRAICCLHC